MLRELFQATGVLLGALKLQFTKWYPGGLSITEVPEGPMSFQRAVSTLEKSGPVYIFPRRYLKEIASAQLYLVAHSHFFV